MQFLAAAATTAASRFFRKPLTINTYVDRLLILQVNTNNPGKQFIDNSIDYGLLISGGGGGTTTTTAVVDISSC